MATANLPHRPHGPLPLLQVDSVPDVPGKCFPRCSWLSEVYVIQAAASKGITELGIGGS